MEVKQARARARLHQQAVQTTVWLLEASLAEEANVLRRWFPSAHELRNEVFELAAGGIWRHLVVERASGSFVSHPPVFLASEASVFLADGLEDGHCFGFMTSLVPKL